MRNLKRALSLALAAVMVIGMMVVGAGAVSYNDFTDKDEIKNTDAVAMVSELGIINGLPNGTFGPTQNIDRASFVKMLCLAYNGGNEPILPANNKVSYVDTAGTWAAQYIEYCTNLNFVAGDGTTGKFNPTSPVTVSQAAKMLLTSLGYSASTEGYVGYDWQMNVDTAANTNKLYAGLSNKDTSSNLTRDDAAQMIYNALNASMVKYEGVWDPSANTIKPQLAKTGKTMLEDKFGAIKVEGVVLANEFASLTGVTTDDGKTNIDFDAVVVDKDTVLTDGTFKVASTLDMIGKTVTMYVKPGSNTTAAKATVLGSLIVSDTNKVVELTASKASGKIPGFLSDENLKMGSVTEYYVNYDLQTTKDKDGKTVPAEIDTNEKGKVVTFIDNNDDGIVEYVLQMVKTFGHVDSYVTTGKGSIYVSATNPADDIAYVSLSNTNAIKEVEGFEDVAKDDYVFFYEIADTAFVEKAEYVDVTVSSIKGEKITADGKTYEASGIVAGFGDDGDKTLNETADLGDEIRLFLDASGYVVYTDAVTVSNDYLFVDTGKSDTYSPFDGTVRVKAVFADGTEATITVDGKAFGLTDNKDTIHQGIYTYTKNSKDVYKLTDASAKGLTNDIKKGKATLDTNVLANGSTVFVVARGNSYSVYTGIANVPSMEKVSAMVVVKDKIAKIVFVSDSDLTGNPEGIYVLDKNPSITGKSDDKTYTYDVIYKGEKTTLTGDDNLFDTHGAGYYTDVEINGGEITSVNLGAAAKDKVGYIAKSEATRASGDLVANKGQVNAYTVDSKTVFLIADGTDVTEASIGAIVVDKKGQGIGSQIVIIPDSDNDGIAATVIICK